MRILAGVDLNGTSFQSVVANGAEFAAVLGAKLDVLYVVSTEAEVAAIKVQLDGLLAIVSPAVRGDALVEVGTPIDILTTRTADYEALIVGPRALSAIQRLLLGTVAAQVIRQARCPVFVSRLPWKRDSDSPTVLRTRR